MSHPRPIVYIGFLLIAVGLWSGCATEPETDGPSFSFLQHRERRQANHVELTITPTGESESSVTLVARNEATGETLTLLAVVEELDGTYPVKVFGRLVDLDGERLVPVSNACSPGDRSSSVGSLSFESHDPATRIVSGSFIANVCRVDDADRAWTLADGKFRRLEYSP